VQGKIPAGEAAVNSTSQELWKMRTVKRGYLELLKENSFRICVRVVVAGGSRLLTTPILRWRPAKILHSGISHVKNR
jgi:hypothetical protein